MIRSIRFTLSLWYVGILAITLCLFGGVLYSSVRATLAQDVEDLLASRADGVADSLFVFLEVRWKKEPTARTLQKEFEEGKLPSLVSRWAQGAGRIETLRPIRLIDREGKMLYVSPNFTAFGLPLRETTVKEAKLANTVYETFNLPDQRVRLVTRPVVEGTQVLYFVQVASSLKQVDASLARLRFWLIWLIPSTLLVTSAVGWFLATLALRPVNRMIGHAQKISGEHLEERIDVPRTGDELERLAQTFNDMLVRLERAFRQLRQFSAAASHELRTPLTVMKGELEVALRRPRTVEEYQEVLGTHLEALNEMSHIVEQLLALARSGMSGGAVDWRPLELGALVKGVHEIWQVVAEEKGIQAEIQNHEPVWIRGEQRLLERLVSNLLDNAIKHTPPKGKVTVRVDREGNHARLTVKDTGSGIPSEELPKIFDRFFTRASGPSKSTGLGLGLCRWIAEAHQGQIAVDIPHQGGAAFTVFLPLGVSTTVPAFNEQLVIQK